MALGFSMLAEPDLGVLPGTTGQVDPTSAWPVAGSFGMALGTGTQQHGLTPMPSGSGGVGGWLESLWQWLNKPFTSDMSPMGIMLLVGTVIISIIIWNLILYHIRIAAEAI